MVSVAITTPGRRQPRRVDHTGHHTDVTAALETLVALPTSVIDEADVVPALSELCATRCRSSRVGVVIDDGGELRLLPNSFDVFSDGVLPVDSVSDPAVAGFLTSGRAETWNSFSSITQFPLPAGLRLRRVLGVPLTSGGKTIGVLFLADNAVPYSADDLVWAERIAPAVAATLDTVLQLLEARTRATEAREAERLRLGEDLHDTALQLLFAAEATIGSVVDTATPVDPRLVRARGLVGSTGRALRDLVIERTARRADLCARLMELVPSLGLMYDTEVMVDFSAAAERLCQRLAPSLVDALDRVAHEAAMNALKHANASRVSIALSTAPHDTLVLTVADDGHGISDGRSGSSSGFGLQSLHRSMQRCGGKLEIYSTASGGTRVTALVTV